MNEEADQGVSTRPTSPFDGVDSRSPAELMLRTEHFALWQLNQMADTKANIMITVSSIVLSISFSQFGELAYRVPLMTLAGFSLAALVLAVLAALPSVNYPKTSGGKLDKQAASYNLLFFGHFSRMPLSEFKRDMAALMQSDATVYEQMVTDIYGVGGVLGRKKYPYLRYSYLLFLVGASLTGLQFLYLLVGS